MFDDLQDLFGHADAFGPPARRSSPPFSDSPFVRLHPEDRKALARPDTLRSPLVRRWLNFPDPAPESPKARQAAPAGVPAAEDRGRYEVLAGRPGRRPCRHPAACALARNRQPASRCPGPDQEIEHRSGTTGRRRCEGPRRRRYRHGPGRRPQAPRQYGTRHRQQRASGGRQIPAEPGRQGEGKRNRSAPRGVPQPLPDIRARSRPCARQGPARPFRGRRPRRPAVRTQRRRLSQCRRGDP